MKLVPKVVSDCKTYSFLGAMLSHDNITWTSRIGMEQFSWEQERLLSYLPLSHIAGTMLDIFMAIYAGNQVHFADKEALKTTLVDNLKRVQPTKLVAVHIRSA